MPLRIKASRTASARRRGLEIIVVITDLVRMPFDPNCTELLRFLKLSRPDVAEIGAVQ